MAKESGDELNVHDRVLAAVDLPGVPAGTRGRVILKNGFAWIRYRALFETEDPNGTDVGSLERAQLVRCDRKWNPIDAEVVA